MKKALPVILFILAVAGLTYSFLAPSQEGTTSTVSNNEGAQQNVNVSQNGQGQSADPLLAGTPAADGVTMNDEEDLSEDIKPAAAAYQSAEAALEAIKKGAGNYDDTILEQFQSPGQDCTWCPQLYSSLKDLLKSPDVKAEDKSYYAEILAISGNVENIQGLVEGLKGSTNDKDKEIYSAALELAMGKDDVVDYLGSELNTESEDVRDSVVAALTNQGSLKAFDTVFKHVVSRGDPDGYYSQGTGPAEMILEESALPKAQEYVLQKNQYSHLALKSMLNSGISGLRSVLDVLGNSANADQDETLLRLKEAIDHVSYDEETEKLLKEKANSPSPLVRKFSNDVLNSFTQQLEADEDVGEENEAVQSLPPTPGT